MNEIEREMAERQITLYLRLSPEWRSRQARWMRGEMDEVEGGREEEEEKCERERKARRHPTLTQFFLLCLKYKISDPTVNANNTSWFSLLISISKNSFSMSGKKNEELPHSESLKRKKPCTGPRGPEVVKPEENCDDDVSCMFNTSSSFLSTSVAFPVFYVLNAAAGTEM